MVDIEAVKRRLNQLRYQRKNWYKDTERNVTMDLDIAGLETLLISVASPALERTLDERGATNGPFDEMCAAIGALKFRLHAMLNWNDMPSYQQEALDMIVHKLGRIGTGDPDHVDHWRDIAGYASLVARQLEKEASDVK